MMYGDYEPHTWFLILSHTIIGQINSTFSMRIEKFPPVMPRIAPPPFPKTLALNPMLFTDL